jgi:NitT/TauT family transport system permease protein
MSGDALSVFIGFLMVLPLIWQSTVDSINSIDKDTMEVARVFEFSMMRKIKLIYLPTLKRFLVPAVISATGLAWKAEIAAEIIAYTKKSIGQGINDAKYNMDTPTVFAWTIVIVTFSILLESVAKRMLRRIK